MELYAYDWLLFRYATDEDKQKRMRVDVSILETSWGRVRHRIGYQ